MKSVVTMLFYCPLILLLANQIYLSLCLPASPKRQFQQCSRLPSIKNPRKCCDIPPVFSKQDFELCNLTDNFQKNTKNGLAECTKQLCVLKTLKFIKDGDKIDREAIQRYMDIWAATNPDYVAITQVGKARCLGKELPGPHELCEANKFVSCIATSAIMACPKWIIEDEKCKTLKNQIETCATYFPQ